MLKRLAAGALLVATLQSAQACEIVEYAKVKRWPVERVEQAYCKDYTEFTRRLLANSIRYGSQYAPQGAPAIEVCEARVRLYARVLEIEYRRTLPLCTP